MRPMLRALALFLVLTFAAGTVAHAVRTSDMAVKMSTAATVDGAMPDCDGCGGNDDGETGKLVCPPTCATPAVAILGCDTYVLETATSGPIASSAGQVASHPALVDPYPPRRHILI